MKRSRVACVLGVLLISLIILACGTTATPTTDPGLEQTAIALGVMATQNAKSQATLQAASQPTAAPPTPDFYATQVAEAEMFAATAAVIQAEMETQAAASVPVEATLAPVEPDPVDTQAQAMDTIIQQMKDKNWFKADSWEYEDAGSFEQAWYDPKTIDRWGTGIDGGNVVIYGEASWRFIGSAKEGEQSGCGFVYGESDLDHWHASFLTMDGIVHTYRQRGGEFIEMKGGRYYGNLNDPTQIVIVVEDKMLSVFINGVEAVRFRDPYLGSGEVSFSVKTGGTSGFTCKIENAAVWHLQ